MNAPDDSTETAFTRLRDLVAYAFSKADYDDPYVSEPPVELKEFGSNTVFVMGAGLLFGGVQQWMKERREPEPKISEKFSKAEKAKYIAELKTRQLIRLLNSTLRGGLWCGWMGALYFGVEGLSAYARKTQDPWNTVLGAWACGSIFGFSLGGPGMMSRMRSAAGAVFLAGLVGYPMGHLQLYLNGMIRAHQEASSPPPLSSPEGPSRESERTPHRQSSSGKPYPVREYDVVAAVIGKLGRSLEETKKQN